MERGSAGSRADFSLLVAFAVGLAWARPAPCRAAAAVDLAFPTERVDEVDIETAAGAISITAVSGKSVKVNAPATGDECAMAQTLVAGVLLLSARGPAKKTFALDGVCAAGYTVVAPPGLRIKARSVSGDMTIGAFSGGVDAKTGSGDIALRGTLGDITAHAGRGSIRGEAPGGRIAVVAQRGAVALSGLTGSGSIRSGDGGVSLAWSSLPMRGVIEVRTADGSQSILVPRAARFALKMRSGSGTKTSEVPSDPGAGLLMSLRSDGGAIVVKRGP